MNFLAHLWLTEKVGLPLAGAVLGDFVRGRVGAITQDLSEKRSNPKGVNVFEADMALSIRLHRRVDVVTDRHPKVLQAIARFEPGSRRYAGILLDMIYDHALALQWNDFSREPLGNFARRAAKAVAAEGQSFNNAGANAPSAWRFRRLLISYRGETGIDRAIARMAMRLRRPEGLLNAAVNWRSHVAAAINDLPTLLKDLSEASRAFLVENA